MPKQSAAALSVAAVKPQAALRLRTPADLTECQAAHWRAVVDNLPADYFSAEQAQQLRAYVTHAALAEQLARRLAELDPLADGWAKLSAAQVSHSKAALAIARALRLTNQSRIQPDTAGTKARNKGQATLELLRSRYGSEQ